MQIKIFNALALVALLWALPSVATAAAGGAAVDHELVVEIVPQRGELRVRDRITLPSGTRELVLPGAARAVQWKPARLRERMGPSGERVLVVDSAEVELSYVLPMKAPGSAQGEPAGAGVSLGGREPWYARVPGRMLTFTLTIEAPEGWRAVSQGARVRSETQAGRHRDVWRETGPQQEIYLIAAPFTEYLGQGGGYRRMAFLRRPDEALARRYLDLTQRYIDMYEDMIGEYPYAKFALVENTRESGYGMPSFTLLGPRVIRLPFIPYTSYPHEVLHNWWGNSVYVDYEQGNWSEGLTTYLADHWLKEQRGQAAGYRRDALQEYRNFVAGDREFPLVEFRARHGEASQAVGYNKGMMLFHMLRRRLGDEVFFDALGGFYRDHRFTTAGFADLRAAFEQAAGQQLGGFFDQWLTRTGAPVLKLDNVELDSRGGRYTVRGVLCQTQPGAVYALRVPVRVETRSGASRHRLELDERRLELKIELEQRPHSLTVDPDFDIFRRPAAAELPPSLGEAFGRDTLTFVIPEGIGEADRTAYREFVSTWRAAGRKVRTITDRQPLPQDGAVWLLGWDNARRAVLAEGLKPLGAHFGGDAVELEGEPRGRANHGVTLAARTAGGTPMLWTHLGAADPARTARRLRHYSRVSYVAFRDGAPVALGQWPVHASPLAVRFE